MVSKKLPGASQPVQLSTMDEKAVFDKYILPFKLVEKLNLKCGHEKSFKLSDRQLLPNRYLLGINKVDLDQEKLEVICRQMNMPGNFLREFQDHLVDANLILLGFEENRKNCIFKIYLEFWDKFLEDMRQRTDKTVPGLLFLGFKWNALDNAQAAITCYTCYPRLSAEGILKRVSDLYHSHEDRKSFEIAKKIICLAASRTDPTSFRYLEAGEENNPRKSFDINFYSANLKIRNLSPILSELGRHYSIPDQEFNRLYSRVNTEIFGHLSGGIDRDGQDFLTVYYEVGEKSDNENDA